MKNLFLTSSFADVAEHLPITPEQCANPRVTFIPTASQPETVTFYVKAGKKALEARGFIVEELEISRATPDTIAEAFAHNATVYISGGNTFYLLEQLYKTGTDHHLRAHLQAGKLYIGESAGTVVLAPNIEYIRAMDDINAAELSDYTGLSCIDFYPLPHYQDGFFKASSEQIMAEYKDKLKLCPFNNHQALWIQGNQTRRINA